MLMLHHDPLACEVSPVTSTCLSFSPGRFSCTLILAPERFLMALTLLPRDPRSVPTCIWGSVIVYVT